MNINFTKEHLAVIDSALQQMPYRVAAPVFAHINAEIQKNFEQSADADDKPSGQVLPADEFAGD